MKTNPRHRSKFWDGILAEGRAEGKAEDILTVLKARGVEVPVDARDRIADCPDIATLDALLKRAVTITDFEELGAPPPSRHELWYGIFADGRAEGRAEDVLAVLEVRGVKVTEDALGRIVDCTNVPRLYAQLDVWLERAVTITEVEELFD